VEMERRKHNRYRLEFPAMFFWKDARGTQHEGVGLTRDISVRGVFIFTSSPLSLESDAKLKVFLPPSRSAGPPVGMHLRGRVVRVEAVRGGEARAGFAVAGRHFSLRRGKEYR
jgi:hypothetical protein